MASSSRMDVMLAERDERRERYREAFKRQIRHQSLPTSPIAIARAINPTRDPWAWLGSVAGGELTKPIPDSVPCPGCYLTNHEAYRLVLLLLKHTTVATLLFNFGFSKTERISNDIQIYTNSRTKLWDPSPAEPLNIASMVAQFSHESDPNSKPLPLRMNSDVIYNLLSSSPRSLLIELLEYNDDDANRHHKIAVIFSLSDTVVYPTNADAQPLATETIDVVEGTNADKMIYMVPIDFGGGFLSTESVEAAISRRSISQYAFDLLEELERVIPRQMLAMRNFARVLVNVKYDDMNDVNMLAKNSSGISIVRLPASDAALQCSRVTKVKAKTPMPFEPNPTYYQASEPARPRPGIISGYCTTMTPIVLTFMLISGSSAPNIGGAIVTKMATESNLTYDELWGRISFNAARMFSEEDSPCCSIPGRLSWSRMYTLSGKSTEEMQKEHT